MIYTRLFLLLTISFSCLSCTTFANTNFEKATPVKTTSEQTASVEASIKETAIEETAPVETAIEETTSVEENFEEATLEEAASLAMSMKQTVSTQAVIKEAIPAKKAIEEPTPLKSKFPYPEFTAEYNATWAGGWFPINVDAKRSLSYQADGTATLTFEADSAIAGLQEISTFRYVDNTIQPLQYRYLRTGLFKEPDRNQIFDWQKKRIINSDNQSIFQGHWNDLVQDNLSYNIQASIDLQQGKTQFTYPVFDRNKIKNFSFQMVGFEVLKTQVGTLRTVKVEQIEKKKHKKKTYIWFAQDYDYLLVRLMQTQKDGQAYQIDLTAADINGKTLRKKLDETR